MWLGPLDLSEPQLQKWVRVLAVLQSRASRATTVRQRCLRRERVDWIASAFTLESEGEEEQRILS